MNDEMPLTPEPLSDEAAFALSEALHWLALVCDEKYYGQIRRHMAAIDRSNRVEEQSWDRKKQD